MEVKSEGSTTSLLLLLLSRQARILEWVAMPSPPEDLPNSGTEPGSATWQVDSLLLVPPGKLTG